MSREDRTTIEEIMENKRAVERMTEYDYDYADVKLALMIVGIVVVIIMIMHFITTGTF